jgi:uncharacterized membrane protein
LTQANGHVDARLVEEARVPTQTGVRLPAIDRMRGLVILLMALDHVRDFFNANALHFDPTDLTQTMAWGMSSRNQPTGARAC